MTQLTEHADEILVAIVDETYTQFDDDAWPAQQEKQREGLERESGLAFEIGNIGPGADLPAFITLLQSASVPAWVLVAGAFFLGKPVHENLSAWREMGASIRRFFARPVYLNRQGAATLAVEAVFQEMGDIPSAIQLLSYRTEQVYDTADLSRLQRSGEIAEAPPTLFLGFIRHIFEIEADGCPFRVSVESKTATIMRLTEDDRPSIALTSTANAAP